MKEIIFSNYLLFLLVLTRMTGVFLFNPFLGRKNVPAIVKVGLALVLAIIITPTLSTKAEISSDIEFVLVILKELLIGYLTGFIISLFVSWVLMAGEMSDVQLGLGMSQIYDPQSNISMPVTGNLYNIMLTLMFFSSKSHLTLIKIASVSCEVFPPGPSMFNMEIGSHVVLLFGDILVLTLKLAIPIIAVELLAEAGLGVLMRTVPQINVFVASIQVKLLIGLIVIFLFLPPAAGILNKSIGYMFERLEDSLVLMLKK